MSYPTLDRTGPIPIHEQIAAWIRTQIASGAWPARFKLKAEVDLARELGVSRGTVRTALAELIAAGLLVQTHGRGTFVTPHVVEQPLADRFITFSEDLTARGIAYRTQVLAQTVTFAKGRAATQLHLGPDDKVFFLQRVRYVDGEPLIVLNNYVRYDRCPGIELLNFEAERLFQALEQRYELRLVHGQRTFQAQSAEREVAQLLNMQPGEAVMHLEQLTFLDDDTAIEWSNLFLRGDSFRLMADVSRAAIGSLGFAVSMAPSTRQNGSL